MSGICTKSCKQFIVTHLLPDSRYESGQCRCQTCKVWMDHNGCHLADGANAIPDTPGWYCNCCGMAVKTKYTQRSAHEVIATKSTRSNLDNDSENLVAKIKTILKDDLPKKRLFEYIDANIQYVNKKDLRSILREY